MPTFLCFLNWTDQGAKNTKDIVKRYQVSKAGGRLLSVYVTTGQYDVVITIEMPNGETMTKYARQFPVREMRGPRLYVAIHRRSFQNWPLRRPRCKGGADATVALRNSNRFRPMPHQLLDAQSLHVPE